MDISPATAQRIFHGPLSPDDLARALIAEFDQGNLRARRLGRGDQVVVQIATPDLPRSGGRTAISVHLTEIEDGVQVRLGQQQWLGVAASLGATALSALRNPFSLLGRLDDVAQDIASLQLVARIWDICERVARHRGATYELSERLRRLICVYCNTPNPVGESHCVACGAPTGSAQPIACDNCGFVTKPGASTCSNCGQPIE